MRIFSFASLVALLVALGACDGCRDKPLSPWVEVPAGGFMMGSPLDEPCRDDDEPLRPQSVERAFLMARHEVTQQAFERAMKHAPSFNAGCAACPVDSVTWFEAAAYCNVLSAESALEACYRCADGACTRAHDPPERCRGYRLPTEVEWERAARGDTATAFYEGGILSCMGSDAVAEEIGWVKTNSRGYTQAVGKKRANPFGLFDMSGNVYEWTDTIDGDRRVLRGGSWYHNAHHARSANRFALPPDKRLSYVGFRCVRSVDP